MIDEALLEDLEHASGDYTDPATWGEAVATKITLASEVRFIQAGLSRAFVPGAVPGHTRAQHDAWRLRALHALNFKETQLARVKAWMASHCHLDPAQAARVRPTPLVGAARALVASAVAAQHREARLEARVAALEAEVARLGGDPHSIPSTLEYD